MALIELENLTIHFGSYAAVDGLSLSIAKGERFGIIGESGSGKSMTAMAIAGLLPDLAKVSGRILFDGAPLPQDEQDMARLRAQNIGFVFQEPMTALNPLMKIGKQIEEALVLSDAPKRGDTAIAALLDEVGLEAKHAERYPHQLSGGQRQRAMIAMALAGEPELLIADEPTSALDVITQRKVLDLIAEVSTRRQMTLLFISHDIKAVAVLCERVGVMQKGKLVEIGATTDVIANAKDSYTQKLLKATRIDRLTDGTFVGPEPLLSVEAATRAYAQGGRFFGRQEPVKAVSDVSFSIGKGECLALVGPSGCGKTTLARMIVGLDSATSGQFVFDGTRYHGKDLPPTRRADISLVFQDPFGSFDPRMTIGQSLGEPLPLRGALSPLDRHARLVEAISAVGLDPKMLDRYPHEFSGGQRQRLAIARAMVTRPKLVVLDEPVSALDVSVRGDILALLAKLRAEHGLSYLIISHDLDMVGAMADRVLVMEKGQIVEEGAPQKLFAQPQHSLTKALVAARLPEVFAA
ncbi:ABC transporter ATP-binding protein [Devosia sp. MC521]|uniref:dipeptide ABC transporter ATP-binding protein n=1 Tax=Devosia sp. MC521 TaxID=2759954 RepID=UPI0015F9B4B3|nr:ABC transporter ATP-binding protein [Devosia sp. MC521]MBJ6989053.1 ABC transporter ATP-binding protein [Devosia sp. MC521]QMW63145.1 ABC transporter ATP-binding protein [Devosia sp. MC521]